MLSNLRHTVEELRLLGLGGTLFRVGFEVLNRSGLRPVLEPAGELPETSPAPSKGEWFDELDGNGLIGRWSSDVASGRAAKRLGEFLDGSSRDELLKRSDEATRGRIRIFSHRMADYGDPVDWHFNPMREVSWPIDVHWSEIYGFEDQGGDIKMVWEVNRFPHVYDWGRAYALTGDSRWARAFATQLKNWEAENPFRAGANWASGQELAIRVLAWLFGLATMGGDDAYGEDDFQRLMRLVELHGHHIERHIAYARWAVHNNHLIGEALGLLVIGALFPWMKRADVWRKKGRHLLLGPCLEQFYSDGGYCQSSHTYHRLALHYLLWARWFVDGDARRNFDEVLQRGADYLAHFQNERDGRLPNWGANDGACLNPWTCCDYADFRPLLSAIYSVTKRSIPFEHGPWDEEVYWFCGTTALERPRQRLNRDTRSFPVSGLHVVRRDGQNFGVMRCGTLRDRFGQADQLHFDLWMDGVNIAVDGGSYLYNDELRFHRYFMGSASHNTVTAAGRDQMLLYRRFKWLYWPEAKSSLVDGQIVEGIHYGYRRDGVVHRRQVRDTADGWLIRDRIDVEPGLESAPIQLFWHLTSRNASAQSVGEGHWKINNGHDVDWDASIRVHHRGTPKQVWKPWPTEINIDIGFDDGEKVRGWYARYYGCRKPVATVMVRPLDATGEFRLDTYFSKRKNSS